MLSSPKIECAGAISKWENAWRKNQYCMRLLVGLLFLCQINARAQTNVLPAQTEPQKQSIEELKKKAESGDAVSQYNLGIAYAKGKDANDAEAVKWFKKAADQGDVKAQFWLGFAYSYGVGVKWDEAEAVKWWRKAADQGDAKAQCNVGYSYYIGVGVEKNYAEAVKWYRKAVAQGDIKAQGWLGLAYYDGNGVEKDYAEAVKLLKKAAYQGDAYAQYHLADAYAKGNGTEKDPVEAYAWYRIVLAADRLIDISFEANRDNLKKTMAPEQIAAAEKRQEELKAEIQTPRAH